jgi:hypothetical protein
VDTKHITTVAAARRYIAATAVVNGYTAADRSAALAANDLTARALAAAAAPSAAAAAPYAPPTVF